MEYKKLGLENKVGVIEKWVKIKEK
jgi:hypothetical protein